MNVPQVISAVVTGRLATLAELDSVYGIEDAHDLLEILLVEAENRRIADNANNH